MAEEVPQKIKVTKLEITTKGGETIALTMEEAKDLYTDLHDLFGKASVGLGYPIIIDRTYYPPFPYIYWYSSAGCNLPLEGMQSYQTTQYSGVVQRDSGYVLNFTGEAYDG